tara:strand:+ start:1663 stop:1992 length:330 start_codon:yes stop_codon:yes gene_type:complete
MILKETLELFEKNKERLKQHSMNCSNDQCPCIIAQKLVKISNLFIKWQELHPEATAIMDEIENEELIGAVEDSFKTAQSSRKSGNVDVVHGKIIHTFNSQIFLLIDEEE